MGTMSDDLLQDTEFLTSLRRDMLRFADLQLRNRAQAEDAVQEALAGALAGREKFASRASLRTWVLGILKNKIVDVLRGRVREQPVADAREDGDLDAYFDRSGALGRRDAAVGMGDAAAGDGEQAFLGGAGSVSLPAA